MNLDRFTEALIQSIKNYLDNNTNIKTLVLGVSGGVDSALVAALAHFAIKDMDVELRGYSLPIATNKVDEVLRADAIGNVFCDHYDEVHLNNYYMCMRIAMIDSPIDFMSESEKIRAGNLKARLRMIYLYDQAQKYNGMVLSTDNYTEYLLGFWTLHGDVGDFGCIQNLWKSEVYDIVYNMTFINQSLGVSKEQEIALYRCVTALPTDGLGVTETDMDQLLPDWRENLPANVESVGWYCYRKIDEILKLGENNLAPRERGDIKEHPVTQRYRRTSFKRNNPYNVSRDELADYYEEL